MIDDQLITVKTVSIHAPVRGATRQNRSYWKDRNTFQFTLPCGERLNTMFFRKAKTVFQFTLPCGERLVRGRNTPERHCFNSRSRAGSDVACGRLDMTIEMFQFTLPCGERHLFEGVILPSVTVSIHAPVRGATVTLIGRSTKDIVSIHAPVRGATL